MNLLAYFKSFTDLTRIRILNLMLDGPITVTELAWVLGVEQPKISRHLKILRDGGVVVVRRKENWSIYSLPSELATHYEAQLAFIRHQRQEVRQLADDARKRTSHTRAPVLKEAPQTERQADLAVDPEAGTGLQAHLL
ncbi:MAG: metalloregulator ArsR/SmtB family transcription factor [Verrucomicrobia bacterium]|nr:metalloregulator ArsR/SmtB family transcription factor [Verrucomicrobiota bacterium]